MRLQTHHNPEMMTPAITVVLPTYNGAEFVQESIESVLAQDLESFELIICDDASTDDTWHMLQAYAGPNCRIVRNDVNLGLFPTLNRLMAAAQSPWIHLWSQDDRMLPGCLDATLRFAAIHPEVAMIYSRMLFIDEEGRHRSDGEVDSTPAVVPSKLAAQIMYFFGSIAGNIANVSLRRDAFLSLGGFRDDMKVSGDYEFWARLSESYPIGFIATPLVALREHRGQFSKQFSSALEFIRENGEIRRRLFSRLTPGNRPAAARYNERVIQVNAFHQAVRYALRADVASSREILRLLSEEANLGVVAARWLISANARTVDRPRLDLADDAVYFL